MADFMGFLRGRFLRGLATASTMRQAARPHGSFGSIDDLAIQPYDDLTIQP